MGRGEKVFKVRGGPMEVLLLYMPWKGICILRVTRLRDTPAGTSGVVYETEYPSMKKRTLTTPGADQGRHLAPMESDIFHQLLALVEHCALRQYDDGSSREPGYLTLRTTGAAWMLSVKDPDTATSFTSVGPTLDKCLETAALLLACDEAPWEADVWLLKGKKKSAK
jgi:hypothetical protein